MKLIVCDDFISGVNDIIGWWMDQMIHGSSSGEDPYISNSFQIADFAQRIGDVGQCRALDLDH